MEFDTIAIVGALSLVVTQVVKGKVPERFVTLIPIVVGVIVSALVFSGGVGDVILTGLVSGLASSGFYDQKNLIK